MWNGAPVWWIFFVANTWYHFIYPCPSQALEQRGHQSGPHGRQGRLWWGEMMPHIGASAMTLPAPDPCDLISPSPQLLAPIGLRWTLVLERTESVGGGEQQKVNCWSEGFYWDWEVERGRENVLKTTVWDFNCRECGLLYRWNPDCSDIISEWRVLHTPSVLDVIQTCEHTLLHTPCSAFLICI